MISSTVWNLEGKVRPTNNGQQQSSELRAASMCRPFPSVFISSFSSSFCPCRPLCQVTRQLFPSSLVRVLWAVAFEYNGPVDAPSLLWQTSTQYFLRSVSVFLFFPRVFFRVLVCFSPGSAFFSRLFCPPSCPHSLQSRPLS